MADVYRIVTDGPRIASRSLVGAPECDREAILSRELRRAPAGCSQQWMQLVVEDWAETRREQWQTIMRRRTKKAGK